MRTGLSGCGTGLPPLDVISLPTTDVGLESGCGRASGFGFVSIDRLVVLVSSCLLAPWWTWTSAH